MSAGRMDAPPCDASLMELPLDVQHKILKLLDGCSLARYAECTSSTLAAHVAPELAPAVVSASTDGTYAEFSGFDDSDAEEV